MADEIKAFLDDTFSYEDVVPMTMTECAANIQYWREDGIEVPEKLTSKQLFSYLKERSEAAKKAKEPLEYFKVEFRETLEGFVIVEAHNEDEAETIASEWYATEQGTVFINDRMQSNGAELFVSPSNALSCDLEYYEAEKSGFTPEK